MPVITSAELKQAVADALQVSISTLAPRWDRICDMAVGEAYRDISGAFSRKGYSRDQLDASDDIHSMSELQGLYWAFVHGAGLHSFDPQTIERYDQRKTMADPNTILDGVTGILQGSGSPGVIQYGRFDTTNDTWTRDTPI